MGADSTSSTGLATQVTSESSPAALPRISSSKSIPAACRTEQAEMSAPSFAAGPESAEVCFMSWEEIPWDDLAFSSVKWALERHRDDAPPGVGFSDPGF